MSDKDYNEASKGEGAGAVSKDEIGLVTPKNKGDEGATDSNVAKEFTGSDKAPKETKDTKEGVKDAADAFEGNKGSIEGQARESGKEGSAGSENDYMKSVRNKVRSALGLPEKVNKINKGNDGLNK
jgi:hypothetical protein